VRTNLMNERIKSRFKPGHCASSLYQGVFPHQEKGEVKTSHIQTHLPAK
jgi:hypothetical protein